MLRGGGKFITIGNFYDDVNTTIDSNTNANPAFAVAYYYIDDVSVVDCTVGINEIESYKNKISLMPNPAKEKVRFEYSEPVSENSQIEVYDNLGVMVKKIILTKGSISTTFSINDLPPGMYLCRVFINNAYSQSNKLTIIR